MLPNLASFPETPALRSDVSEAAISKIAVKNVAFHACHKNIGEAVVVEIADGDPDGIAFARKTASAVTSVKVRSQLLRNRRL